MPGCCADTLTADDLVACSLHQPPRPGASLDAALHLAVLQKNPDLNAVLHSHGAYSVAMTMHGEDFYPADFEGQYYFKKIPVISIPYDRYMQQAAEQGSDMLRQYPITVVRGHGGYAAAKSLNLAYKWTCSFELSAKTCFLAKRWHLKNVMPVVLCFSGHDPTGGAGIQADIEAINSQHCHATAVITALTVQDTHNVRHFECVDAQLLMRQARAVFHDMNISAIKIGMIGSIATAEAIHALLREHADIPVILDPILAAGGGGTLSTSPLIDVINKLILPYTYVATPNTLEAQKLAGCSATSAEETVIKHIAETGVKYVLLTGTHANTHKVRSGGISANTSAIARR